MIEMYLLEQLSAFYQYGTLSAASEQLHISQPALSRSMKKLEDLLGVTLFERQKNKLTLNENGLMAAEHAARILELEKNMITQIRTFDRQQHTMALGSCAPAPIFQLTSVLSQVFPDMIISTELKKEEVLLQGLEDDTYQIIILTHPMEGTEYYCRTWKEEHLFVSLPPAHPLATAKQLSLSNLDTETFLLYSRLGFWYDLCTEKMPHARFIIQNEYEALGELVLASALPAFSTNLVQDMDQKHINRVLVPISDPEANVTYYGICKKSHRPAREFLSHSLFLAD